MQTARDKLRELRALHEDGLLSQQEFDSRKNAILDAEYAPPGGSATPMAPSIRIRHGTEIGLMAGQEIGPENRRYRLERLLKHGGMGQVWQATDLATQAELGHSAMVALKILPPATTMSAVHARLLVEEATQARRLAHEHIVRVYEWAQDPATASYFLIMECLEGQDLDSQLAIEGAMPLARAQALLAPVAAALDYAWDKHALVHRDIKPANVFVTARGDVKLLDFGIAARSRSGASLLGLEAPGHAGTSGYRAPEAGTHQGPPVRTLDVYSVAVMIYQMVDGRMPFSGERSAAHHPAKPAVLSERQWDVLQRGFAYTPEARPPTVSALLDALAQSSGPTAQELAAEREEQERQVAHQRQRAAALAQEQTLERAQRQKQQADAAAASRLAQERQQALVRREQEARARAEQEAARQERKEALRLQLQARREADAEAARQAKEEQQRKALQSKALAAYRAEQQRAREQLSTRTAEEMAAAMAAPTPGAAVADPEGVLRDRFTSGVGAGPQLVLIPTGRFQMGSPEHERAIAIASGSPKAWLERETPQHWVGIERPIALGRFPVTVGEWRQFVLDSGWKPSGEVHWVSPGFRQTDEHPVVGVTWLDAQQYLAWLRERTGERYRLPSEAEWEYCCRAGSRTAFSFGDAIDPDLANYDGNFSYNGGPTGVFRQGTTPVWTFAPNAWGLFDMHGNVWEWVQDTVHENYEGAPVDGSAWESGGDAARRILRGGSWQYHPRYLRSALRNGYAATLSNAIVGFRVLRELD